MTHLERLRELLGKATPGPWQCIRDEDDFFDEAGFYGVSTECRFPLANMREVHDPAVPKTHPKHNAALIAASVNALPALLDVAEAAGVLYHDGLLANRCGCEPEPADRLCRYCELAFAYEALTRADDKNNQQEKSP